MARSHVAVLTLIIALSPSPSVCQDAEEAGPWAVRGIPSGEVQAQVLATGRDGGWLSVDLLVPEGDALAAAMDCARARGAEEAVSCFAFNSREAYSAAGPAGAGSFTLTCWSARWSRNKSGSESGGRNEFMPPSCPRATEREPPPPPSPTVSTEAEATYELMLTLEPGVIEGRRVMLGGTTNLPDGVVLSTSVRGSGFLGQERAVVSGGRWQSGPFGPSGGLTPGSYQATVTLPWGRAQPEAIQNVLGQRLERLTGPLMETNPDLEYMGQSASVHASVIVR